MRQYWIDVFVKEEYKLKLVCCGTSRAVPELVVGKQGGRTSTS